eukprot:CAMPEP_0172378636 /NCGR_PEP_ID=MMETSP1060-20121228/69523_1 /TAXON_ID=37318 /ORGANISM="Pseudo-nitzschia pungens, Strain cf. cingulata" /LENGTH=636 /DNA_ID=CAMNT_0013106359 /DNA_START=493 /DNA_END=2403 /DNA_ORIENTATION=+
MTDPGSNSNDSNSNSNDSISRDGKRPPPKSPWIRCNVSAEDCSNLQSLLVETGAETDADAETQGPPPRNALSLVLLHGSWNGLWPPTRQNENEDDNDNNDNNNNDNHPTTTTTTKDENSPEFRALKTVSALFAESCDRVWKSMLLLEPLTAGEPSSDDLDLLGDYSACPTSVVSTLVDPNDPSGFESAIHELSAPEELPALVLIAKGDAGTMLRPLTSLKSRDLKTLLSAAAVAAESSITRGILPPKHRVVSGAIANALLHLLGGDFTTSAVVVPSSPVVRSDHRRQALRIFVAGDRSRVGKSSVCMGLIGTLVGKLGVPPSRIAYIKPATQCEAAQLVAKYCEALGVEHRAVGPIVYYKGFTRAFLEGATESSAELLDRAGAAVDTIARDKDYVVVDGVGYPAVGSICGTDNASVARACGVWAVNGGNEHRNPNRNRNDQCPRIPVPVLLVGKRGVGDAIDSHNLNAAYFATKGVPVLGSVFNRLPSEGYYSLENCKAAVSSYFASFLPDQSAFGFVPEVPDIAGTRDGSDNDDDDDNDALNLESAERFVEIFADCVDVPSILATADRATRRAITEIEASGGSGGTNNSSAAVVAVAAAAPSRTKREAPTIQPARIQLTREQVEEAAKSAGAAGG